MNESEKEAEELYPTKYYDDYPTVLESFSATSDDLQEAYIRGRTAEPSGRQIEAAAEVIWMNEGHGMDWEELKAKRPDEVPMRLYRARQVLDAARRAIEQSIEKEEI